MKPHATCEAAGYQPPAICSWVLLHCYSCGLHVAGAASCEDVHACFCLRSHVYQARVFFLFGDHVSSVVPSALLHRTAPGVMGPSRISGSAHSCVVPNWADFSFLFAFTRDEQTIRGAPWCPHTSPTCMYMQMCTLCHAVACCANDQHSCPKVRNTLYSEPRNQSQQTLNSALLMLDVLPLQ